MGGNGIESQGERYQRRDIQEERMTKKQLQFRKIMVFLQKAKIELQYQTAVPLLGELKVGI